MNILKKITFVLITFMFSCSSSSEKSENTSKIINPTNEVILSSEIVWEQLNPARGDASPLAGTIWGDRKADVPTGYLGKFIDGFSSPPHIHNVSYRAVVIKGSLHNDDPAAAKMWMPAGNFWTQPQGEAHITAAKGEENIAYIEIDHGPYLVKPIEEAFDNGERPINIDASNIVWVGSDKTTWVNQQSKAELSHLWESKTETNLRGLFVSLPREYTGTIKSLGSIFYAIVIKGNLEYTMPQNNDLKTLDEGSCFSASAKAIHTLKNKGASEVILYIRTNGSLKVF